MTGQPRDSRCYTRLTEGDTEALREMTCPRSPAAQVQYEPQQHQEWPALVSTHTQCQRTPHIHPEREGLTILFFRLKS